MRTDVGKFSFVSRTFADWNRLPEGVIGIFLIKTNVFRKTVRKVYRGVEVKVRYMVGIAHPVWQRAMGLTARVQFSGISSFSFVLFSYVLLTSLCINVFAFCTFCIMYYLCITVYLLVIVYVKLPPGISPIAIGNIYMTTSVVIGPAKVLLS
jgi:hypothetical protein